MNRVRIVADSTCDLPKEVLEKYGISIIPLCIVMDGKSYYDGEDVTPDEIFKWADENKTTPKTAAISFDKTEKVLKPFMDAGEDIIFFGISSKMSTTCNVARIFAEQNEYGRMFVIDSENLSTGIGLQVIKAAEMAAEGKSAEDIVSEIEASRSRVRASFVVDTLTYLARGGRCNAVTALMASAFKIHPLIAVKDGSMGVAKKYRGKLPVALSNYVNDLKAQIMNAEPKRVFITHSGCDGETVEMVRKMVADLGVFEEILINTAGGVISSHCGPATLGVLFYEKD
ncbi:MAG: DegV family protein [Clostridia bacterium]|nr:DegV family protein [Clostridia bacterium]